MKTISENKNMRGFFAELLHEKMKENERIWVVTNDLGFRVWDTIRKDFPKRFVNVGAAEQTMMGVGVGLALEGKIPVVYSITTFLLYRPFETIRNYLQSEKIPVKLIGSGRDKDYHHDGISHWAEEDKEIMKIFFNIEARWPSNTGELPALIDQMISIEKPWYINLTR